MLSMAIIKAELKSACGNWLKTCLVVTDLCEKRQKVRMFRKAAGRWTGIVALFAAAS